MLFLLEQHLFTDKSTGLAQFMLTKSGARQFKLDFLKTVSWRNHPQMHLVGWEERSKIIEAEQTRGDVRMCLLDFICSDDVVIKQPEYIDLPNDLLECSVRQSRKRGNAEIA